MLTTSNVILHVTGIQVQITKNSAQGGKAKGGGVAVRAGVLAIAKSTVTHNSPNNCSGQIQGRC